MKHIWLGLLFALSFLGCSDEVAAPVVSKVAVGKSLSTLTLNDQFEKKHHLSSDTKKVVFAFSKDMGHLSNEFFEKKGADYLKEHHVVFIADVSGAPSLIRSMFIMPGLKEFKHTVLVIENKAEASAYRNDAHKESLMVLDVKNFEIEKITYVNSASALEKAL